MSFVSLNLKPLGDMAPTTFYSFAYLVKLGSLTASLIVLLIQRSGFSLNIQEREQEVEIRLLRNSVFNARHLTCITSFNLHSCSSEATAIAIAEAIAIAPFDR